MANVKDFVHTTNADMTWMPINTADARAKSSPDNFVPTRKQNQYSYAFLGSLK